MPEIAPIELPVDFYPILPWGRGPAPEHALDPERGIASMAACGFTLTGFVNPELLPVCEEQGLKAIVHPNALGIGRREWLELTSEEIDARMKRMVAEIGDSPALLGYYLIDEPGASLFPALGSAVAALRRYAPGKLAYINLFPGYATIGAPDKSQLQAASFTEYLERYVEEVRPQFVSYDNYIVQYSQDMLNRDRAAVYYSDLLEVRRVAKLHGLPFWNICSSNQIRPFTPIPSPANLLFQTYTTLAAGGRGLGWFTYDIGGYAYRPIDEQGRRTPTWQYLRMANRQVLVLGPVLNRLHSTGVFFTSPPPVADLPLLPGATVTAVQAFRTGQGNGAFEGEISPVMVGEFADDAGTPHAMLVNLSLGSSVRVVPQFREPGTWELFSAENGSWAPLDHENGAWLVAGQGVLMRHAHAETGQP
jgi:hypothetical protein